MYESENVSTTQHSITPKTPNTYQAAFLFSHGVSGYQELLLGEHRCWDIQLYNTKHI